LNILTRAASAFEATIQIGPEFTEAAGIKLQYTRVAPGDQSNGAGGFERRDLWIHPIKEAEQVHIMMYDEANAACAKLKSPAQGRRGSAEQGGGLHDAQGLPALSNSCMARTPDDRGTEGRLA
jgi:hypothetical protein